MSLNPDKSRDQRTSARSPGRFNADHSLINSRKTARQLAMINLWRCSRPIISPAMTAVLLISSELAVVTVTASVSVAIGVLLIMHDQRHGGALLASIAPRGAVNELATYPNSIGRVSVMRIVSLSVPPVLRGYCCGGSALCSGPSVHPEEGHLYSIPCGRQITWRLTGRGGAKRDVRKVTF